MQKRYRVGRVEPLDGTRVRGGLISPLSRRFYEISDSYPSNREGNRIEFVL